MGTVTYIFAGGGSGGHLFPGIAIADELRRQQPSARCLFVGSERPLEADILRPTGYEHRPLSVEPLRALRRAPWKFWRRNRDAFRASRQLLKTEQPRWVIGLGGYISAPTVWTAWRWGIPILLLEQNVIPGVATRWLSRLARHICLSFEETRAHLPRGVPMVVTGNPVRDAIRLLSGPLAPASGERARVRGTIDAELSISNVALVGLRELTTDAEHFESCDQFPPLPNPLPRGGGEGTKPELANSPYAGEGDGRLGVSDSSPSLARRVSVRAQDNPLTLTLSPGAGERGPEGRTLLILGGSQGAESLNDAVAAALIEQKELLAGWRVVHQTGPGRTESIRSRYHQHSLTADVADFFPNVAEQYAAADLVISRSGATTLAELACVGCPAILLPYPFAADQHQRANAEAYARRNAAIVIPQDHSTSETVKRLQQPLRQLLRDHTTREQMGRQMRELARPDAARHIAELLLGFVGGTLRVPPRPHAESADYEIPADPYRTVPLKNQPQEITP